MIDATQSIFGLIQIVGNHVTGREREVAVPAASQSHAGGRADKVSISPAAERAARFGQVVSEAAKEVGPASSAQVQGKAVPLLIIDFDALMAQAETRLGELMADLAIDSGTDIAITSHNNGTFSVESDHPKAAELEAAINEDQEMRNALIGAHNVAAFTRIATATAQAIAAADANPAMTETYYSWIQGVANEAKTMDFRFTLANGDLSSSFVGPSGQSFAMLEGLRLPA